MFSFFKKNKPKDAPKPEEDKIVSAEEQAALTVKRIQLEASLESAQNSERIGILNELGAVCFRQTQVDSAIRYYEMSIGEQPALGRAYTDLLKLYNMKRREAAKAKDDAQIALYMDKIDQLMKLTKETMRSV